MTLSVWSKKHGTHFLFGLKTSKLGSPTDSWDHLSVFFKFFSSFSPYPFPLHRVAEPRLARAPGARRRSPSCLEPKELAPAPRAGGARARARSQRSSPVALARTLVGLGLTLDRAPVCLGLALTRARWGHRSPLRRCHAPAGLELPARRRAHGSPKLARLLVGARCRILPRRSSPSSRGKQALVPPGVAPVRSFQYASAPLAAPAAPHPPKKTKQPGIPLHPSTKHTVSVSECLQDQKPERQCGPRGKERNYFSPALALCYCSLRP